MVGVGASSYASSYRRSKTQYYPTQKEINTREFTGNDLVTLDYCETSLTIHFV